MEGRGHNARSSPIETKKSIAGQAGLPSGEAGRIRVELGGSPALAETVGSSGFQKGRSAGEISLLTGQGLVALMQEGILAGRRRT